jgi:hypothetical protein
MVFLEAGALETLLGIPPLLDMQLMIQDFMFASLLKAFHFDYTAEYSD